MILHDAVTRYLEWLEGQPVSSAHQKTVVWALKKLSASLGEMHINVINHNDLRPWAESLRKDDGTHYSHATLQNITLPVKQLFNWLVDSSLIESSPAKSLPTYSHYSSKNKAPSESDFKRLVRCLPDFVNHRGREPIDIRDAAIVSLSIDCAGRLKSLHAVEVPAVKKALYSFEPVVVDDGKIASIINVHTLVSEGKGVGRFTKLRFYNDTAALLSEYLAVRPKTGCAKLFVSHQPWRNYGGHLAKRNITQAFLRVSNFAGIRPIRSHAVRHRTLTDLVLSGADINTVAKYADHKDPRTTMRHYVHVNSESVDNAGASLVAVRSQSQRVQSGDDLASHLFGSLK